MEWVRSKVKSFLHWVWRECRDWHTVALLAVVIAAMYSPVWGGYLVHLVFGWEWGSVVASAVLLFWAGPFTPFFPLRVGITLAIKRALEKRK